MTLDTQDVRACGTRQTIVSVEKGHFDPSLPLAFRLASIFECQIEDIFSPDEP
ncbi:helix-turn-helix transcriptional regulator [Bowdeniella massiliensis]|uniref:helix-turn-helix transcriptional regulator n=1 Tax=Bowdeniella massiliensis TaxID=2932264 RepID=UPI0020297CE1|nr:hypothetical protein [Bowdeniella massiliensis]